MNKDIKFSSVKFENGKPIWKTIHSTSDICQFIQDKIEDLEESRDYWREQAKKNEKEIRQEFVDKINEKNELLSRSPIILSSAQKKDYDEFRDFHYHNCYNNGHYVLDLSGTGLGWEIKIKCPICKKVADITHSEEW